MCWLSGSVNGHQFILVHQFNVHVLPTKMFVLVGKEKECCFNLCLSLSLCLSLNNMLITF